MRSNLSKLESEVGETLASADVEGGPVKWGPMSGGRSGKGLFTVKSNASWVMVTWGPLLVDRMKCMKEECGQPIIYTNPLKSTHNKNTIAFSNRAYSLIFKTQCICIGINARCWCLRYCSPDSATPGRSCPCPKPCTQTVYEPSLSQASLSVLSVDNILHEDFDLLLQKYRK